MHLASKKTPKKDDISMYFTFSETLFPSNTQNGEANESYDENMITVYSPLDIHSNHKYLHMIYLL